MSVRFLLPRLQHVKNILYCKVDFFFFWFEWIGTFYQSRKIITMVYILSRCKDSNKLIQYYIINNKL